MPSMESGQGVRGGSLWRQRVGRVGTPGCRFTAPSDDGSAGYDRSVTEVASSEDSYRRLAWGLASAHTLDDVCQVVAAMAAPAIGATVSDVAVRTPIGRIIHVWYPSSFDAGIPSRWSERDMDEATPLTDAIRNGHTVIVDDLEALRARYPAMLDIAEHAGADRFAAYPFGSDDPGGARGAIGFGWQADLVPAHDDQITSVVALCGAALTRAWATDENRRLTAITRALTRDSPLGFALLDSRLRYLDVNERLAETNGRTVSEHLGRTIREVVPDLADDAEPRFRAVFDTGEPQKLEISGTTPAQADDDRVWEEMIVPVRDDSGNVIAVAVTVEDVTERRRSREELRRLYRHEHSIAVRLQQGLLPRRVARPEGYDLAVRYVPGSAGLRIGGDWYETVRLGDDQHAFVIGDVVGHGIDAAIAMIEVRHSLAALSHAISTPDRVLDGLDEVVTQDEERFVATLVYGLLSPPDGRLLFSVAGHPPPLIISADGSTSRLDDGRGPPLGISGSPRPLANVTLARGDTLVLYTDGLIERRGEDLEMGLERLVQVAATPIEGLESFADYLIESMADPDHEDDIALMLVHRHQEVSGPSTSG